MKINEKEYTVEVNTAFIQPHIMINGMTTDVGYWKDFIKTKEDETKMLESAVRCYEYNLKNKTIKSDKLHIHQSEK